jgi:hypothetical protein
MGDVVNLRRARKQKARETADTTASVNRSLHGLSKRERKRAKACAAKENRDLEALRLDCETSD